MFIKPVLRSGLSALPIRPAELKPLVVFHKKVLRAILKLSKHSPVVPLYFMLGELPIEATVHYIFSAYSGTYGTTHRLKYMKYSNIY